jgi:hypothetical protein
MMQLRIGIDPASCSARAAMFTDRLEEVFLLAAKRDPAHVPPRLW